MICRLTLWALVALLSVSVHSFVLRTPSPLHVSQKRAGRPRLSPLYMTLEVGSTLPDAPVKYNGQVTTVPEIVKGKRALIFAVPGAFTPKCSGEHLPSYIQAADELRSLGIEFIGCLSTNDAFVLKAWEQQAGAGEKGVSMISDGNAAFTQAAGMVNEKAIDAGMGLKSARYAAVINKEGKIEFLAREGLSMGGNAIGFLRGAVGPNGMPLNTEGADASGETGGGEDEGERSTGTRSVKVDKPIEEILAELVNQYPVFLFMKGVPAEPRCGFSATVVAILRQLDVEFVSMDVLSSDNLREGVKSFSNFPTFPQLFVKGELQGGADIVKDMYESGELKSLLVKEKLLAQTEG
uniref:Thioredoxin domain-containing protein n=1 Tax=Chromera velia CCMP2878 TaxID=1169474 RepID=A0A0G4HS30_9ALVE|mmetsp:Transcript_1820/g.3791  ORF Transcript_1820/g.3791 Transcript_1820/m.3791 type:complete len:351 (+) Transcript_1820:61-1113(+)|eukprot:Cvel_1315.t1-p1 / transcript=Cvel_1315.t1 / gene=Cvel_1315 / organism=Chromera_velia_CCMP2878 / gene_product=Peroxiredoxin-2E-2, chloroplastic, putative / transcript_product=Peroxiredoxin-2E-2, chloroplastic, putative / location=Cvel_scaffold44:158154-163460(-) / protein_length=350 / sequence_SO=supercontig / SO=protein_coding / is_pseudo=false